MAEKYRLRDFCDQDVIDEVERRTRNGSNLIEKFPDGTYKVRWWGDTRPKLRKGSRKHLWLKYAVSDDDLILECMRRVEWKQSHEFLRRWQLMLRRVEDIRFNNMFKDVLGEALGR